MSDIQSQQQLIQALHNPEAFPHPADNLEMIETHISWVILAGPFAYKIKKKASPITNMRANIPPKNATMSFLNGRCKLRHTV